MASFFALHPQPGFPSPLPPPGSPLPLPHLPPSPPLQGRIKDELLALSADLSNARSECSRVGDSYVKRADLEARVSALAK